MAEKNWEPIKISFCHHLGKEVALEAELIYPAEFLPDQNPRVTAHRCSRAVDCNLDGKPSCIWAGTNPAFDPFSELQENSK
jgi:hypothetical protein